MRLESFLPVRGSDGREIVDRQGNVRGREGARPSGLRARALLVPIIGQVFDVLGEEHILFGPKDDHAAEVNCGHPVELGRNALLMALGEIGDQGPETILVGAPFTGYDPLPDRGEHGDFGDSPDLLGGRPFEAPLGPGAPCSIRCCHG